MRRLVDAALLAGVVALVVLGLVLGSPRSSGGEGEKFGGTDAAITQELDASGYEPWFEPIFAPSSGEVEAGLFAVQAGLGAGVLGYCLGALRTRARYRRAADATATPSAPAAGDPTRPDSATGDRARRDLRTGDRP
ncbi:energy-coupling factor ABC transporter substrate-binding protein [Agilicoccus flavus]|uniref:energy-coupling factor ABC transporter substrate-binding protein n=1 Tax=Agilicoccus flavus TaxID=2775968 RepID=UPI001CF6F769|nr:energy-coupling factor ABC transporter substrate-binding protein [Agilicoccus flavus]